MLIGKDLTILKNNNDPIINRTQKVYNYKKASKAFNTISR